MTHFNITYYQIFGYTLHLLIW